MTLKFEASPTDNASSVNYDHNMFIKQATEPNVMKLLYGQCMNVCNELVFVPFKLLQLSLMLQERPEPTLEKQFSGAPLNGRFLALPTNIRLGEGETF